MIDKHKYIYKRDKPFIIKLFGIIFVLIALMRVLDTPLFSLIIGIGSIGFFVYQRGIEIDLTSKKYMYFTSFGPQIFGKWQDLPEIKYISVFKAQIVSSISGRSGATISRKKNVIQVNLITINKTRIKLLEIENKAKAFEFAQKVSEKLNLRIYDATERNAKFLD